MSSGFDSGFLLDAIVDAEVERILTQQANAMCARWNYEAGMVDMEMNTMDVADEDAAAIYDSIHGQYIQKSHLTKHVSEAFHAEVVDGESKGSKRLKIIGPQNVSVSDAQRAVLNIITDNMRRTV